MPAVLTFWAIKNILFLPIGFDNLFIPATAGEIEIGSFLFWFDTQEL